MRGNSRLWAPWRSHFVTHQPVRGCIFCRAIRLYQDKKNFVIHRGKLSFAILNLYPYNNGHVMVAPRRHVGDLSKLTFAEWAEMLKVAQQQLKAMKRSLKPHGFNLGLNLGRTAGAGIPGHLHMHVVPRWNGDTNFMPILSSTKVISQSLAEVYQLLADSTTRHGRSR